MNLNREITFWGIAGCFFSALMISLAKIVMGTRRIDTLVSTVVHSMACIMAGGPIRAMTANNNLLEGIILDWHWVTALVLLGFFNQITLAKACELEDNPSNIAVISAFDVVVAYFLNIFLMGVEVSYVSLIGSIIVMFSIAILAKSKRTNNDGKAVSEKENLN